MLGRVLLFLAVFAPSVLLLNTDLRPPESEAKPLVIAGEPAAAPILDPAPAAAR